MNATRASNVQSWEHLYNQVPLCDVPRHFAGMRQSPFLIEYLTTVLKRCPEGGRTCETGIGSGYGAIWLSLRGIRAEGIDYAPGIVERAIQINNILGGAASFRVGDLFDLYQPDSASASGRYDVIHHQGVLEHFTVPQIRAALAQQVALADWVVFSVPSVYYPFEPEFGNERLLPLEEWARILAPFDVAELKYYGDPALGGKEHVLGVLRGQKADFRLEALMRVPDPPYPHGISAIVHTKNEARHIAACLETLKGWTDEIIVCDMESSDETVAIAKRFTDTILSHPQVANFDCARNVSAMRAKYGWVLYLDADERVPPGLGQALRELVAEKGDTFEGLLIPFRHYFAGRWMQCLYPGYTAPRLLKNGCFVFHPRLHSGASVEGRITLFPADDPNLALEHFSFESLAHYLDKLNRYTEGEAENMHKDGHLFHWQNAIAHFVHDFQAYYDQGQAGKDSVHGFLYAFLSAFYRFEQHAKLFERRYHARQLKTLEIEIPGSVDEVLAYALSVARQKPLPQAPDIQVRHDPPTGLKPEAEANAQVVWSGPLYDPSGYGEESRHFLFALEGAVPVAAQPLPWSHDEVDLSDVERTRLGDLCERPAAPGFVHILQNFPTAFTRHPQAGIRIGRTMFETDRLPEAWMKGCNRMDYVWVPSEFNRETFARAGVEAKKLVVIPGCFEPKPFLEPAEATPLTEELKSQQRFTFLSIFDWTQHKGWDVLLRSFLEAFEARDDVALVLKVWSTMGYSPEQIREQAADLVKRELDYDLLADSRIRFVQERLTRRALVALYQACDAFVLPSRGEGWGRPYMEAMACGKPTIGTNWSGNTAFMNPENSYLLDCQIVPVPEEGWREIPTYRGHRWAEPDREQLKRLLRQVTAERGAAAKVGERASVDVTSRFNPGVVGRQMKREIDRIREEQRPHLVMVQHAARTEEAVAVTVEPAGAGAAEAEQPNESDLHPPTTVRWEGAQFMWHSLAHVNREFCKGLLESGQVELSLVSTEPNQFRPTDEPRYTALAARCFAPLSRPAQVHVRHFFPPRFDRPAEGHLVLMQPWEYGFLPQQWIRPIEENVTEVWCYSHYVRDVYRRSGIPEAKLHVVPLGVDAEVFSPDASPYVFTAEPGARRIMGRSEKPFVFLFVGGTLHRKGIDILLDAYLKAFSAYDDVCLVIKDTGTQTVYYGQTERDQILRLVDDHTRPPIVYFDQDLTPHQLAGIYTASDCLVQPYRGEGFCLPALEAMACGRPVIVPQGGPTDDFVDEEVGWRVAASQQPFGSGRIGEWDCVGQPWMLEVSPHALAKLMRLVYIQHEEVKRRGSAAARRVREAWTWDRACEAALKRLEALRDTPAPPPAKPFVHSLPSVPDRSEEKPGSNRQKRSNGHGTEHKAERRNGRNGQVPAARETPTISLCMIVKNEERVLADCLKSARPWVDEIVMVDTGSTDRTVQIAESFGAKVFHFPWCDDFSAARNESLRHAAGDWLLWMDADDTLPEACGAKLHELVMLAEARTTGFLMQVHIPPAPGDHGFTIVDHVKLFRNRPELRFEGRIHEQILESIYRAGGQVERSNLFVVHSGYDHSPAGQQKKRERDWRLLELDLADRPEHPFVWFNIGMTAFHLKDFEKAIPALEKCLSLSKPHESTVRKVYAMLAGSHLDRGDLANARVWLEKGLSLFPRDPELLFRAGIIYREVGDLAAAEQSYLKLLTAREVGHIDSLDVSMMGYKAHHNLALIYQDLGRFDAAEVQWRAAVESNPAFVPSWRGLGELYLRLGRSREVEIVANRLSDFAPREADELCRRLQALATPTA